MKIVFGHPATLDQDIRPVLEKRFLQHKSGAQYRFKFKKYLNIQLVISVLFLTFTTAFYHSFDVADKLFAAGFILITLINCGALLEQRKWIYYLECFRLMLIFTYVFFKFDLLSLIFLPTIVLIILERTFALSSIYKNYVLQYEKVDRQ
ncbi:MAG: hypothetical protein EOO96_26360 [Pedobacter sp.]|nr:MAG: hypothetical protein EOO96_26360 [Pedobacter sp.]